MAPSPGCSYAEAVGHLLNLYLGAGMLSVAYAASLLGWLALFTVHPAPTNLLHSAVHFARVLHFAWRRKHFKRVRLECVARKTQPYRALVLEGGGVKGIAYGGAIRALEESLEAEKSRVAQLQFSSLTTAEGAKHEGPRDPLGRDAEHPERDASATTRQALERARTQWKRTWRSQVNCKASLANVIEALEPLRLDAEPLAPLTDETLLEHLQLAGRKIEGIAAAYAGCELGAAGGGAPLDAAAAAASTRSSCARHPSSARALAS